MRGGECVATPKRRALAAFADARSKAKELLVSRDHRFLLMQAWMLALLFLPICILMQNAFGALGAMLGATYGPLYALAAELVCAVLLALLVIFALFPYLLGILHLALGIAQGKDLTLSDVFAPFADRRAYGRALLMSVDLLWRPWLVWLIADTTWYGLSRLLGDMPLALPIRLAAVALEVLIGLILCVSAFPRLYRQLTGEKRASGLGFFYSLRAGLLFWIGYVPHVALGFLTLGILLLSDTLPRMCLCYICYCKRMTDELIYSEEQKHE